MPTGMNFHEVVKALRCDRTDCDTCPMHLEEQVEQHLYRVYCAAGIAAVWLAILAEANKAKDERILALQQRIENPEVWE